MAGADTSFRENFIEKEQKKKETEMVEVLIGDINNHNSQQKKKKTTHFAKKRLPPSQNCFGVGFSRNALSCVGNVRFLESCVLNLVRIPARALECEPVFERMTAPPIFALRLSPFGRGAPPTQPDGRGFFVSCLQTLRPDVRENPAT